MGAKIPGPGPASPKSGSAFGRKRPPILSRTATPQQQKVKGSDRPKAPIRLKGRSAS